MSMITWSEGYTRETGKTGIEPGDYRCFIQDVEEKESKAGNPMIVVTLQLNNGRSTKVKDYIVKNQYFNRAITQLFDAFPDIGEGNFNFIEWIGATGAGRFDLDDRGYLKLKFFLTPKQAENLPQWIGEKPQKVDITKLDGLAEEVDEPLPF